MRTLREILQLSKCDSCKRGDFSQCHHTKEDAGASLENTETGEIKYFCCAACCYLYLLDNTTEEEFDSAIAKQYNLEGHYEKLQSFLDDYKGPLGKVIEIK